VRAAPVLAGLLVASVATNAWLLSGRDLIGPGRTRGDTLEPLERMDPVDAIVGPTRDVRSILADIPKWLPRERRREAFERLADRLRSERRESVLISLLQRERDPQVLSTLSEFVQTVRYEPTPPERGIVLDVLREGTPPERREAAAWTIGWFGTGSPDADESAKVLSRERDPRVAAAIVKVLLDRDVVTASDAVRGSLLDASRRFDGDARRAALVAYENARMAWGKESGSFPFYWRWEDAPGDDPWSTPLYAAWKAERDPRRKDDLAHALANGAPHSPPIDVRGLRETCRARFLEVYRATADVDVRRDLAASVIFGFQGVCEVRETADFLRILVGLEPDEGLRARLQRFIEQGHGPVAYEALIHGR
jgi:hypothetical protein